MKKYILMAILAAITLQAGMNNDLSNRDGQYTIKNYFTPIPKSYYYTDSEDICAEIIDQFIDSNWITYRQDWLQGCTSAARSARKRGQVQLP